MQLGLFRDLPTAASFDAETANLFGAAPAVSYDFSSYPKDISLASCLISTIDEQRRNVYTPLLERMSMYSARDLREFAQLIVNIVPNVDKPMGRPVAEHVELLSQQSSDKRRAYVEQKYARTDLVVGPLLFSKLATLHSDTSSVVNGTVSWMIQGAVAAATIVDDEGQFSPRFNVPTAYLDEFSKKTKLNLLPDFDLNPIVGGSVAAALSFSFNGSTCVSVARTSVADRKPKLRYDICRQAAAICAVLEQLPVAYRGYLGLATSEIVEFALITHNQALYKQLADQIDVDESRDDGKKIAAESYKHEDMLRVSANTVLGGKIGLSARAAEFERSSYNAKEILARTRSVIDQQAIFGSYRKYMFGASIGATCVNVDLAQTHSVQGLVASVTATKPNWYADARYEDSLATIYTYLSKIAAVPLGEPFMVTLYPWRSLLASDFEAPLEKLVYRCTRTAYEMYFSPDYFDPYIIIKFKGLKVTPTTESAKLLVAYMVRQLLWSTSLTRSLILPLSVGTVFTPSNKPFLSVPSSEAHTYATLMSRAHADTIMTSDKMERVMELTTMMTEMTSTAVLDTLTRPQAVKRKVKNRAEMATDESDVQVMPTRGPDRKKRKVTVPQLVEPDAGVSETDD